MQLSSVGLALLLTASFQVSAAKAHDEWANGKPVPDWVKQSCCGPADAHHLRPDQVHDEGDYYIVDGYEGRINKRSTQILPSQDGSYWIFYRDKGVSCTPGWTGGVATQYCSDQGDQSNIYCFFVPMDF